MTTTANTYRAQEIAAYRAEGLSPLDALQEYHQSNKRARLLQTHAARVARDIAQGAGPGTLPIQWTGNGFEPIAIEDCPRSWEPHQIAAYRELGEAIARELAGNRQLFALVAHYCTTEPENQLGHGSRYRAKQAIGLLD